LIRRVSPASIRPHFGTHRNQDERNCERKSHSYRLPGEVEREDDHDHYGKEAGGEDSKYTRLTPEERALVLALHAREMPQAEIAKIVRCHPSSVCRTLKFVDTREGARLLLNQGAAKLADKVVRTKSAEVARKVLTQTDVLPKEGSGTSVDVRVMLGVQMTDEQLRELATGVMLPVKALPRGDDAA
jgi:hypothetical protein